MKIDEFSTLEEEGGKMGEKGEKRNPQPLETVEYKRGGQQVPVSLTSNVLWEKVS